MANKKLPPYSSDILRIKAELAHRTADPISQALGIAIKKRASDADPGTAAINGLKELGTSAVGMAQLGVDNLLPSTPEGGKALDSYIGLTPGTSSKVKQGLQQSLAKARNSDILKPTYKIPASGYWKRLGEEVAGQAPQIALNIAATYAGGGLAKAAGAVLGDAGILGDVASAAPKVAEATGTAAMFGTIAGGEYSNLVNKEGVSPKRAAIASLANAAVQAPMEQFALGRSLKAISPAAHSTLEVLGFGKAPVESSSGILTNAWLKKKFSALLGQRAQNMYESGGTEFITELLQQYPDTLSNLWAKSKHGKDVKPIDSFLKNLSGTFSMETLKSGAHQGVVAAPFGLLLGGLHATHAPEVSKVDITNKLNEVFNTTSLSTKEAAKAKAKFQDLFDQAPNDEVRRGLVSILFEKGNSNKSVKEPGTPITHTLKEISDATSFIPTKGVSLSDKQVKSIEALKTTIEGQSKSNLTVLKQSLLAKVKADLATWSTGDLTEQQRAPILSDLDNTRARIAVVNAELVKSEGPVAKNSTPAESVKSINPEAAAPEAATPEAATPEAATHGSMLEGGPVSLVKHILNGAITPENSTNEQRVSLLKKFQSTDPKSFTALLDLTSKDLNEDITPEEKTYLQVIQQVAPKESKAIKSILEDTTRVDPLLDSTEWSFSENTVNKPIKTSQRVSTSPTIEQKTETSTDTSQIKKDSKNELSGPDKKVEPTIASLEAEYNSINGSDLSNTEKNKAREKLVKQKETLLPDTTDTTRGLQNISKKAILWMPRKTLQQLAKSLGKTESNKPVVRANLETGALRKAIYDYRETLETQSKVSKDSTGTVSSENSKPKVEVKLKSAVELTPLKNTELRPLLDKASGIEPVKTDELRRAKNSLLAHYDQDTVATLIQNHLKETQRSSELPKTIPPLAPIELTGTHLSANSDLVTKGIDLGDLGLSIARSTSEEQSPRGLTKAKLKSTRYAVELNGLGLDYGKPSHKRYIDSLTSYFKANPEKQTGNSIPASVIKHLQSQGVDFVNNYTGEGLGKELRLLKSEKASFTKLKPSEPVSIDPVEELKQSQRKQEIRDIVSEDPHTKLTDEPVLLTDAELADLAYDTDEYLDADLADSDEDVPDLLDMFASHQGSSTGLTSEVLRDRVTKLLGLNRLPKAIKIVQSIGDLKSLGKDIKPIRPGDALAGFYSKGAIYLIADHLNNQVLRGVLIHEGGHYLRHSNTEVAALTHDLQAYANHLLATRPDHPEAIAYQKAINKAFARNAGRRGFTQADLHEEALMYFMQDAANAKFNIFKKSLTYVQRWAFKLGINTKVFGLSPAAMGDIVASDFARHIRQRESAIEYLSRKGDEHILGATHADFYFPAVDQLKQVGIPKKATSEQYIDLFKTLMTKGRVNKSELIFSGLMDKLTKEKFTTRDEIFKYLRENNSWFTSHSLTPEGSGSAQAVYDKFTLPGVIPGSYKELLVTYNDPSGPAYTGTASKHYEGHSGILGHLRAAKVQLSNGRTGYMLYEVQSDLSTDISKKLSGPDRMPFRNSWPTFLFKHALHDAINSGADYVVWPAKKDQVRFIEDWNSDKKPSVYGVFFKDFPSTASQLSREFKSKVGQTTVPDMAGPWSNDRFYTGSKTVNYLKITPEMRAHIEEGQIPLPSFVDKAQAESTKENGGLGVTQTTVKNKMRAKAQEYMHRIDPVLAGLVEKIIKGENPEYFRSTNESTTSVISRILSSPEYYLAKDKAANRVLKHAQEGDKISYETQKHVEGDFLDVVGPIAKRDPKAYNESKAYLNETDKTGAGFSLRFASGYWQVHDPADTLVGEYASEKDAVKKMNTLEQKYLTKKGMSAPARQVISAFRDLTNRGFDIAAADLQRQVRMAKERGLPEPTALFTDDTGKTKALTLSELSTKMGDLRGTYFPRERLQKKWVLRATKGDRNMLLTFSSHISQNEGEFSRVKSAVNRLTPMARKIKSLKADGWTVEPPELAPRLSETVYDAPGMLTSINAIIQEASSITPPEGSEEAYAKMLSNISGTMTQKIADIHKQKGSFKSRMRRSDTTWEGYEEDPIKAAISYSQRIASGAAKRTIARNMLLAFTGRDISFNNWKNTHPDGTMQEYNIFVKKRAVDPNKQKELWEDTRQYITHVLKPTSNFAKSVGYAKALTSLWFLGGRISSAAINSTNMFLGVPATIMGHTGLNFPEVTSEIARAAGKYAAYRASILKRSGVISEKAYTLFKPFHEKLSEADRKIFAKISELGWDEAHFNAEATKAISDMPNLVLGNLMHGAMFMFGATEKANRAITIFAAYQAHKLANESLTTRDILDLAHHTSDRAHGNYGKTSKPWLVQRIPPLDLPYTFMKFQHNYMLNALELGMKYKNWRAMSYMLLAPAVLAGPAASPVLMALSQAARALGRNDPEEEFYAWVEKHYGSTSAITQGARSGLAGALFGVNLKGSLQMNNPLSSGKLYDILGAPGGLAANLVDGTRLAIAGEGYKAFEKLAPSALSSIVKGVREHDEGITNSGYSPVFYGTTPLKGTTADLWKRALGFNPAFTSGIREQQYRAKLVAQNYTTWRRNIKIALVQSIVEHKVLTKNDYLRLAKVSSRYNEAVGNLSPSLGIPFITSSWARRVIQSSFKPSKVERRRIKY